MDFGSIKAIQKSKVIQKSKALKVALEETKEKYKFKSFDDIDQNLTDLKSTMTTLENYVQENTQMIYKVGLKINGFAISRNNEDLIYCTTCGKIGIFNTVKRIIKEDAVLSTQSLFAIMLTPDEKYIIATGVCKVLKIYTYPELHHYKDLEGHTGSIVRLAKSYDGKWLFSTGEDSSVRRWDLSTFTGGDVLYNHEGQVKSLTIEPNNRYLFSGGEDKLIRVYDLELSKEIKQLEGHTGWVWAIAVSPNNKFFASGSSDNNVRVWSMSDFLCLKTLTGHTKRLSSLQFSPDNQYIVSGCTDTTLRIWPVLTKASPIVLQGHTNWVKAFLISHDQKVIYSAGEDFTFRIWVFPEALICEDLTVHSGKVTGLCVTENSKYLVSAGEDKVLKVWDIQTNELFKDLAILDHEITCLKKTPYNNELIVGDNDGGLHVYDLEYFNHLRSIEKGHNGSILCMAINTKGTLVATTGIDDYKICIFSIATLEKQNTLRGSESKISSIAFTTDSKFLISGHESGTLKVWDAIETEILNSLNEHSAEVKHILITKKSDICITGDKNGFIVIWDFFQKTLERKLNMHEESAICGLYLTVDEHYLISADITGTVSIWDLKIRQTFTMLKIQNINLFTLDPLENKIFYSKDEQVKFAPNPMKSTNISLYGIGEKNGIIDYLNKIMIEKKTPKHDPEMDKWIIMPYKMNTLHIYTYYNLIDHIKQSIKTNFRIIKSDKKETPLSISIYRGSYEISECIIEKITQELPINKYLVRAIEDCIILLNYKGNTALTSMYENIMIESTDITLPKFCSVSKRYPIYKVNEFSMVNPDLFGIQRSNKNDGQLIVFKESLIRVILYPGSKMSIEFLRSLYESPNENIFKTSYIQSILLYKWGLLGFYMLIQTIVYTTYIILLCIQTSKESENTVLIGFIFALNGMLFLFELLQMGVLRFQYWKDPWNYLDLTRSTACLLYYSFLLDDTDNIDMYSLFIVVHVTSWLRGITYFRVFKNTRYMINLLKNVLNDMKSFMMILLYSIVSFSYIFLVTKKEVEFNNYLTLLYKISLGDVPDGYDEKAFEFILVTVAVVINPIVLLNLLISIIGDTFNRVQSRTEIADMKELCQLVIETEQLLFWRLNLGIKNYIQVVNTRQSEVEDVDQWDGKIKEIDDRLVELIQKNTNLYDMLKNIKDTLEEVKDNTKKSEE